MLLGLCRVHLARTQTCAVDTPAWAGRRAEPAKTISESFIATAFFWVYV